LIEKNNVIFIGQISKHFGIQGKFKVYPLTDFPDRFLNLENIYLFNEKSDEFVLNKITKDYNFPIEWVDVINNDIKLKFKDFDTIDEINELMKLYICIDENDRVKLKKGDYYYYELIGCDVLDNEINIGKLASVMNLGSADLLNVKDGKQEILIPFVSEFVKKIDIKKRIIYTELIDGFYEKD